jgi:hypothetical protein
MDPALDPAAPLADARARALPNSDFMYVSDAEAGDFLATGGVPATRTPLAEACDNGSCWAQCPAGTGVTGSRCWRVAIHGTNGSADLLNQIIAHDSDGHGVLGIRTWTAGPLGKC